MSGIYKLSATATNRISTICTSTELIVYDEIQSVSLTANPTTVQNGSVIDFIANITRGNDVDITLQFFGKRSMRDDTTRIEWAYPYHLHHISVK